MFINAEIGFTTYALYVIKANAPPIVNSPFIIKSPLNIYNNAFTTVSITTTLTVLYSSSIAFFLYESIKSFCRPSN